MYTGKSVAKHSQAQIKQKARWMALGMLSTCIGMCNHALRILRAAGIKDPTIHADAMLAKDFAQKALNNLREMK